MPFISTDIAPEDVKVVMNLRVSWRDRERLRTEAAERGISLNQLIINALQEHVDMGRDLT